MSWPVDGDGLCIMPHLNNIMDCWRQLFCWSTKQSLISKNGEWYGILKQILPTDLLAADFLYGHAKLASIWQRIRAERRFFEFEMCQLWTGQDRTL